jgi:hypothetical protein
MVVYSKQRYNDQDDGCILKGAREQHDIAFPAPIVFLNDVLKAELVLKANKEEEKDDTTFYSLKMRIPRLMWSISIHMIQGLQKNSWDGD